MTLQKIISRQLRRPAGLYGYFVGRLMSLGNKEFYETAFQYIEDNKAESLLEIGFGNGSHFPKLFRLLPLVKITGIDISTVMLKTATRSNSSYIKSGRLDLQIADIKNIPLNDNHFDIVLTINTIYFWDDPHKSIEELYRVLKPNGILLLGMNSKQELIKNRYRDDIFTFWETEDVKMLLEKYGFRNLKHHYKKLKIEDCECFIATK